MARQRLRSDQRGAAAVEFMILTPVILAITFGIIEFGLALMQWNSAEKATQLGVRLASVSDPVAPGLKAFDGLSGASTVGDACMDPDTGTIRAFCKYTPDPVICTSSGCNGYGFSSAAFDKIFGEIQRVFPQVQPENVVIEYASTGLGFVGRPGAAETEFNLVPEVTIRLQGMIFQFVGLSALFDGFDGGIPMPAFSASLVGEDLSDTSPAL